MPDCLDGACEQRGMDQYYGELVNKALCAEFPVPVLIMVAQISQGEGQIEAQ